jgi:hypothetical protein
VDEPASRNVVFTRFADLPCSSGKKNNEAKKMKSAARADYHTAKTATNRQTGLDLARE